MGGRSENPVVKKQPILITDAARSQDEQFRSRQLRYVTMMGLRAAWLIANDRPARSKAERAAAAAEQERHQQVLAQHSAEQVEYLTIDVEPVDGGERWAPADPDRDRKPR
jgi:hypothetical protein